MKKLNVNSAQTAAKIHRITITGDCSSLCAACHV